jgi:hypothetical protein
MSKRQRKQRRNARRVRSGLGAAGLFVLAVAGSIAAGCSGQPEPPDMPPFAGTEEFLEERARNQHAVSADEAFREKFNLGDPEAIERRGRIYLRQRAAIEERARQIELAKEREQKRHARERAEEGRRRFEEMEQANRYREDLRREREKAAEGKRRFAEIARANQYREDPRRRMELEAEGKRRFAETQTLNASQKREAVRKERERKEEGRLFFSETQSRRS